MSTRRMWVKALLLIATVAWAAPARAGVTLAGANTDFPDNDLVMPFATTDSRSTFFAVSNVSSQLLRLRWVFFDESGEKIDEVGRDIFDQEGTDIVDITAIADRTIDNKGNFVLGPSRSLAGRNGFVIVYGDGTPSLLGNFTIANLTTNSAFGVNASGFGSVGTVAAGQGLLGTTFSPQTLQDSLLTIIALNPPPALDSLTRGARASGTAFSVQITLIGNDVNNPVMAQVTRDVRGSALQTSLADLFPGQQLSGSATIFVFSENAGLIGYYGQAVGPFGAGQTLRATPVAPASMTAASRAKKAD